MHNVIFRHSLIKKIRDLPERHVFISAPGGYGKTIAATQWIASGRGAVVKMTAGDADNDPNVFFRRIAQALCRLTGAKTSPAMFTAADIVRMPFPARHARCHLLIDDVHRIENSEALDGLSLIAARLPGYVRMCVSSRIAPPDAIVETGAFSMLTQDDLLFSQQEAELLAAGGKCDLTRRQIRDLLRVTGGWAMYLSALLSDGQTGGVPPSLSQYLETRVWNGWDGEIRNVLIALAIPEALTPELCERLTGRDGRGVLKTLTKEKNVFLSRVDADRYRFHDVFREFLLSRAEELGEDELRRLNTIAAEWHFEQGDYFASIAHFIKNRDQEGISRCIALTFQLQDQESSLSIDRRYHFTCQYILKLPDTFVAANPYLLMRRTVSAYHGGNAEAFTRDLDLLHRMQPEIAGKYPDLDAMYRFFDAVDMRMPMRECIRAIVAAQSPAASAAARKAIAGSGSYTQNLPFYHRSMRDFSEYHELQDEDLACFNDTLGVFVGGNSAIRTMPHGGHSL